MSELFAGRIKQGCLKVCMACDDDIHNALESLRHKYLSREGYDQFERFVCQLHKSIVYTEVNEVQWLFGSYISN